MEKIFEIDVCEHRRHWSVPVARRSRLVQVREKAHRTWWSWSPTAGPTYVAKWHSGEQQNCVSQASQSTSSPSRMLTPARLRGLPGPRGSYSTFMMIGRASGLLVSLPTDCASDLDWLKSLERGDSDERNRTKVDVAISVTRPTHTLFIILLHSAIFSTS